MLGLGLGLGLRWPRTLADYVRSIFRLGQDVGWHWQFDNPLTYVGPTYMYQDTAGTTPVTAVGQGIGLLLGREYGGAKTQFSTNDSFASAGTGWSGQTGWSFATGSASVNSALAGTTYMRTSAATVVGTLYEVTFTVSSYTSGSIGVAAGTAVAGLVSAVGTYTRFVTANTTDGAGVYGTSTNTVATVTRVTVRAVPGTHLTQATGTAKPTLSARVNLLLSTEALGGAAWAKSAAGTGTTPTVTDNYAAAPDGTMTAARLQANKGAGVTSPDYSLLQQQFTLSGAYKGLVWLKSNTGASQNVYYRVSAAGAVVVTTEWQAFPLTETGVGAVYFTLGCRGGTGSDSSIDILVWHPDLRTADDAAKNIPAYQRVGATAADHDTDGFPHYAEGDGTDNCWASVGTVDGSATDKLTVVAAVTKNSDAAGALLLELTADSNSNNGAFFLSAPQSAAGNFGFKARGTVVSPASGYNAATYAAPTTRVLGLAVDLAASVKTNTVRPYIDAVLDQGEDDGATVNFGGNFANATLYALSRGGSSGRFNGRFYGSTGRFGPMSDSERNNLTRWWQKRIGTA